MFWIQGKVHLWSYVNQALLWINMAENQIAGQHLVKVVNTE
jgi:hypothetical protein